MPEDRETAPASGEWRRVLSGEEAAVLSRYARPRGRFAGVAPTLLVIDVTEAFVGPDLPVARAQEMWRPACGERAWAAVPAIKRLVESFRAAGRPVVFTAPARTFRRRGRDAGGSDGGEWAAGAEIIPSLEPRSGEWVLAKPRASAFFDTPLADRLADAGCDTVVLAGGTTSGCVRASAVDGSSHGFKMLVAEDACFDRVSLSHLVSLADLDAKYARVLPTAEILSLLALA